MIDDIFAHSKQLRDKSERQLAIARSLRRPVMKVWRRVIISKLCGMLDCGSCSGWTPKKGRGRLIRCDHGCHREALSA